MKPELAEAIEVFRELGWDGAPHDRAPDLPIGTPAQQRLARGGLGDGTWGHFGEVEPGVHGWISDVPVDAGMLGLFAVRVGIGARRALEVVPSVDAVADDVLVRTMALRGPKFAAAFIAAACLRDWRSSEWASSPFGPVAVRLAHRVDMAMPAGVGYLMDWLAVAGAVLGAEVDLGAWNPVPMSEDEVRRGFVPHLEAAVDRGLSPTGPLAVVVPAGVARAWISRPDALRLSFAGLDRGARPSDRAAWAALLAGPLEVTDDELAARADALVAALATGEAPVVEAFAPRLLGVVPDDLLADVLATALTARTKKALLVVLKAGLTRRPPAGLVDQLAELVQPLVEGKDKAVAAAASGLLGAWGAEASVPSAGSAASRGLWQPTPPLWEGPPSGAPLLADLGDGLLAESAPGAVPGADRSYGRYLPQPSDGVIWRQLVRRAAPLTGREAIHLLGVQRTAHPRAAEDLALAVSEAWQRGLLRPGVADVTHLRDGRDVPQVAALAEVLLGIAHQGMASVAWPVLDDLLIVSLEGPRMTAGTGEVAEAMRELVPEALAAVASRVAEESVLDVPGLRALAARGGSSRAVVAAREAVALLPERSPIVPSETEPECSQIDLDAVWPAGVDGPDAPDDRGVVQIRLDAKSLAIDVVLPDQPGTTFRVRGHGGPSFFDFDGRVRAWQGSDHVHLRWTGEQIVVDPVPLASPPPEVPAVLPLSLVVAALASVAEDGQPGQIAGRVLGGLVEKGRIGSSGVRAAMRFLLTQPEVSPARVVRVIENHPHLLPTLWPLLTEPIRAAGGSEAPPPRWLNQVLAVAITHAPTLRAAATAGRLPADAATWPGLAELAARPGKSAALDKARSLQTLLS
ncbi:hypothetical protein CFH99_06055 [Nocardioides aromaticivorans]|uniref:Uncharacterized protein n=1 Tax=Nocardioides aromaticivorans TaxID=200618 RepID=A0ABX7PH12_9ACTN|nr:hypothetical protein [Nocardioides aromaticivorans]QSR25184.1 hypothetical protein CFH99_06055 [Nocardioides aromaticivorans]